MKLLLRHQLPVFLLLSGCTALFFLLQIWQIHPLYANSETRSVVQAAITQAAEQRGWLLSGISLKTVTEEEISFDYIDRRRGSDIVTCHVLTLSDRSLRPCDAAR